MHNAYLVALWRMFPLEKLKVKLKPKVYCRPWITQDIKKPSKKSGLWKISQKNGAITYQK